MSVHWQAEGYHTLTACYHVTQGAALPLMEFLRIVFDAEIVWQYLEVDDRVVNAEVRIGDSRLHISEPWGGGQIPRSTHHASVYVPDVDAVYHKALQAGAVSIKEPSDMSWGDRLACVEDPSGIWWHILTAKRIVTGSPERYW